MKDVSKSTVVYKGIEEFKNGAERIDVTQLPQLIESGWEPKEYVLHSYYLRSSVGDSDPLKSYW